MSILLKLCFKLLLKFLGYYFFHGLTVRKCANRPKVASLANLHVGLLQGEKTVRGSSAVAKDAPTIKSARCLSERRNCASSMKCSLNISGQIVKNKYTIIGFSWERTTRGMLQPWAAYLCSCSFPNGGSNEDQLLLIGSSNYEAYL